jgi:hypothetical protein
MARPQDLKTSLQLSAIPQPVVYTPIQPVPQVGAVKGRATPPEDGDAGQKVRSTPPPGVGTLLDIDA